MKSDQDLNFGAPLDDGIESIPQKAQLKDPNQPNQQYNLSNASHPFACVFTFLFKAVAFLLYFIIGSFISNVSTFIGVVLLSAIDFWTVKNVTGRLLVGLRWWSDFDAEGKEVWKFESYEEGYQSNRVDAAFFWTAQWAATGTWAVFLVLKLLSLDIFWALLVSINLALSAVNLYGFFKCRRDQGEKISKFKSTFVGNVLSKVMK